MGKRRTGLGKLGASGAGRLGGSGARPFAPPAPAPRAGEAIYTSQAWRSLRARIRRDRGGRCEACGADRDLVVDHIVELVDGGAPYDPTNLMLVCARCHATKTAQARRDRQLRPLFGRHAPPPKAR